MTDQQKPRVPYWHLYTDENGISRQRRCILTRFELKSMQSPADPQWQGERYHDRMTTMVTVQPVGWVGTWHENPAPQWIIPLSGRWWVESMDGERVEMGPGLHRNRLFIAGSQTLYAIFLNRRGLPFP